MRNTVMLVLVAGAVSVAACGFKSAADASSSPGAPPPASAGKPTAASSTATPAAGAAAVPQTAASAADAPAAVPASQSPSGMPVGAVDSGAHATQGATSTNKAVELHVDKYDVASSFQGTVAQSGHAFVILDARWHNILEPQQVSDSDTHPDPTYGVGGLGSGGAASKPGAEKTHTVYIPYLIPDVKTQLQLIVNGESGAKLVNGALEKADLLSADGQRIEHGKDVSGRYVFDVTSPVTSIELAYFDKMYGNIRIPIAGSAPAADAGTIAGPVSSGGLMLSVMRVDETDAVGGSHAPSGMHFVVVTARGQGDASVGDNYLEIDPASASRLSESDGHLYPTAKVEGGDDEWSGPMRFVPATPQRGRLIFAVPAQHGPLALSVAVPRQPAPMRLPLSRDAAPAPKLPNAIVTVQDGSTGMFYLYGVRQSGEQLVLDVGIENRSGSGMDFQTKEQIELLQGSTTITATDEDLAATPRSLPEDAVIPPHTFGRFDIPFRVPSGASGLTLYFRGFENEKKIPLPAAR